VEEGASWGGKEAASGRHGLRACVDHQVLRHEDDEHVLGRAAPRQVVAGLRVGREESLTEQRQDDLGLARAHLGEVEALLRRDYAPQEGLLLGRGYNCVPAVLHSVVASVT